MKQVQTGRVQKEKLLKKKSSLMFCEPHIMLLKVLYLYGSMILVRCTKMYTLSGRVVLYSGNENQEVVM